MNNLEKIKRLKKLKYLLNNHDKLLPKLRFDLKTFGNGNSGHQGLRSPKCTTAACALGSAALYEPFKKLGLVALVWSYGVDIRYKGHFDFDAGEKFFGITHQESYFLFSPDTYLISEESQLPRYLKGEIFFFKAVSKITSKDVAKRVQQLINYYSSKIK